VLEIIPEKFVSEILPKYRCKNESLGIWAKTLKLSPNNKPKTAIINFIQNFQFDSKFAKMEGLFGDSK